MRDLARYVGLSARQGAFNSLVYSLRTGRPAFDHVHGADWWTYFAAHPELSTLFNKAMGAMNLMVNSATLGGTRPVRCPPPRRRRRRQGSPCGDAAAPVPGNDGRGLRPAARGGGGRGGAARGRPAACRRPGARDGSGAHRRVPAAGQPDRPVRDRRADGRHRAHRSQDNRRHVRRDRAARRRRVLRQGPVQSRPLGRVRAALGGQARGRGRAWPGAARSTCGRRRSSRTSTCSARYTAGRRRTGTSAGNWPSFRGRPSIGWRSSARRRARASSRRNG